VTARIPSPDEVRRDRDARVAIETDAVVVRIIADLRANAGLSASATVASRIVADAVVAAMTAAGWVASVESPYDQRDGGFMVAVGAPAEVQP
jgi:hypothetical protein